MNKKLKGFTLAEMMVSMLIISIILAAIMPTVVKNIKTERDHVWRWTADQNNSIYFNKQGNGSRGGFNRNTLEENQLFQHNNYEQATNSIGSVFVGLDVSPKYLDEYCGSTSCITYKPEYTDISGREGEEPELNGTFVIYTHNQLSHPFQQSHIDLFENSSNGLIYDGRIAADNTNIAFGIGTLHRVQSAKITIPATATTPKKEEYIFPEHNTGIGQFSLYSGTTGTGNTALGYNALSNAIAGSFNTAAGYNAGTGITYGEENVFIGANAGAGIVNGNRNTLIGSKACQALNENGDRNICIGYNASGNEILNDDNSTDRLFIGSAPDENAGAGSSYSPLISGHLNFRLNATPADKNYDKDINFNLKDFNIKTYNGSKTMFRYTAKKGTGYGAPTEYYGENEAKYYLTSSTDKFSGYKLYGDTSEHAIINVKLQSKSNTDKGQLWLNGGGFKINVDNNAEVNLTDSDVFKLETTTSSGTGKIQYSTNGSEFTFYKSVPSPDPANPPKFNFESKKGMSLTANSEIYAYAKGIKYISENNKINISGKKITVPSGSGMEQAEYAVTFNKILSVLNSSRDSIITIDGNSGTLSITSSNNSKKITLMNTGTITAYDLSSSGMSSVCGGYSLFFDCANYLRSSIPSDPTSDIRLKNVSGNNITGLDEINKLEIKKFTYKNDKKKTPHVGVIAQDLQKIFPNSVFKGEDGYLKIKTEEIFYAAINAIKQLYAKLQTLTIKAESADKKVTLLENETQTIKTQSDNIEKRLRMLETKSERK